MSVVIFSNRLQGLKRILTEYENISGVNFQKYFPTGYMDPQARHTRAHRRTVPVHYGRQVCRAAQRGVP